jgi:cytoskeletal protein RodZ
MDRQTSREQAGRTPSTAGSSAPSVDPAEFAEYLRAERERRRVTLDQIADETKIASRHLAALERGDVRDWPGGMYRRAMMRAYAESIGVDREFALKQFEQAFDAKPDAADAPLVPTAPPRPVSHRRLSRRHVMAIAATFLFVVAGAGVWKLATSFVSPDFDASTPVAAAPAAAKVPAVQPASTVQRPAAREAGITTGVTATTGVTERRVTATEGSLLVASDPPGARVTVNGIGWGQTPVAIRNLEFGSKRVRVTMQGFLSQERVVQLGPERANSSVRLTLREREQARVEASR